MIIPITVNSTSSKFNCSPGSHISNAHEAAHSPIDSPRRRRGLMHFARSSASATQARSGSM